MLRSSTESRGQSRESQPFLENSTIALGLSAPNSIQKKKQSAENDSRSFVSYVKFHATHTEHTVPSWIFQKSFPRGGYFELHIGIRKCIEIRFVCLLDSEMESQINFFLAADSIKARPGTRETNSQLDRGCHRRGIAGWAIRGGSSRWDSALQVRQHTELSSHSVYFFLFRI